MNRKRTPAEDWVDADTAAALLGVRKATLYAYVSRGKLTSAPGAAHNQSIYLRGDIERLAQLRGKPRRPRDVARAALAWGLPVLESSLTLIDAGQLYYRGVPANLLARSADLEEVACLLWTCDKDDAFSERADIRESEDEPARGRVALPLADRMLTRLASLQARHAFPAESATAALLHRHAALLLRLSCAAALGTAPAAASIHHQFAQAWRLEGRAEDAVRVALVLSADHELNASSFVARCVASTGADLGKAVVGGLAALSGGLHGGMTEQVEAMWDELGSGRHLGPRLVARLARGEHAPGFGHPLYPDGDPRARDILACLPSRGRREAETLAGHVLRLTGHRPSLDFALVALRRAIGAPRGGAFALFGVGRTVGWLAHAIEQRATGSLIRPRAAYAGNPPDAKTRQSPLTGRGGRRNLEARPGVEPG